MLEHLRKSVVCFENHLEQEDESRAEIDNAEELEAQRVRGLRAKGRKCTFAEKPAIRLAFPLVRLVDRQLPISRRKLHS